MNTDHIISQLICGALSRYLYKVGDHKSPESKKNTWKAELGHTCILYSFLAFYLFGGYLSYNEVRQIVYRFKGSGSHLQSQNVRLDRNNGM